MTNLEEGRRRAETSAKQLGEIAALQKNNDQVRMATLSYILRYIDPPPLNFDARISPMHTSNPCSATAQLKAQVGASAAATKAAKDAHAADVKIANALAMMDSAQKASCS